MSFNRGGFNRTKVNSTEFSSALYADGDSETVASGSTLAEAAFFTSGGAITLSEGSAATQIIYPVRGVGSATTAGVGSAGVLNLRNTRDITYAIVDLLRADAQVTAHVDMRIYRKKLPLNPVFPAVTVSKVDNIRDDITNTGGYAHARLQCTTWARYPGQEEALAEQIAVCLHQKQNSILAYGAPKKFVYIVSVRDAGGIPDENAEIPLYMEHRDFMIHYDYR